MPPRIKILASVLAVVATAAAAMVWRSGRVERTQPLAAIKPVSVSRIQLERGGEEIILERRAGAWKMLAPVQDEADSSLLDELVESLGKLTLGSPVSGEASSYVDFDLTEASATRLRLYTRESAAPVFDAYFGKEALGEETLYLRLPREKPVYLATGLDAYPLRRAAQDWRERDLVSIKADLLESLKVRAGKTSFEIRKSSAGWTATGAAISPEKLEPLVRYLCDARVSEFAPRPMPDKKAGLDPPLVLIEAQGISRAARWRLGKARPEAKGRKPLYHYAKAEGREGLFLVSVYDAEAILRSLPKSARR